jgi:eukaryotic-like serine/threonine-protein kinase
VGRSGERAVKEVPSLAPTSELADRYELGEPLGFGATAAVLRATHRESGRRVAVKIFTAGLAASGAAAEHRSEAATLAVLHHPGIVEIEEAGVHDGSTYLVMRLVEGESLAHRIARGPLPAADVVAIGAGLADALRHVHARGFVHRDVKPSNVLLDARQAPHLTDFGVAKLVDATRVTATGSTVGTPAYMAPEQVRGHRVGPAADVYALGLVLLEALTGLREYQGTVVESAVARLHRDPVVPSGLPPGLGRVLRAMTAQDPADRPSAATVARTLTGPPAGRSRRAAQHGLAAAAVAAVLLLAAAVGSAGLPPEVQPPVATPRSGPAVPAPAAEPVEPQVRPQRAVPAAPAAVTVDEPVRDAQNAERNVGGMKGKKYGKSKNKGRNG